jgi:hypothetical protein
MLGSLAENKLLPIFSSILHTKQKAKKDLLNAKFLEQQISYNAVNSPVGDNG